MTDQQQPDKTKVYTHFGLDLPGTSGDDASGDCLFCGKERHFNVNRTTGQYRCVRCGEKGNATTFLRELHSKSVTVYGEQSEDLKGINAGTLRRHKIVRSCLTGEWLVPSFSREGKLMNLGRYAAEINKLLFAPGCRQMLYMLDGMSKNATEKPAILCEGHWDALALDMALHARQQRSQYDVIGVPGATAFQDKWVPFFAGRPVWIMFDNDTAGRTGTEQLIAKIKACPASKRPSEVKSIRWPDWFPDKFDVRDAITSGIPKPIEVPTIVKRTAMQRA